MAEIELLQFHTLYWALEELSAEFDAPATLPSEQIRFSSWISCLECLRARLETLETGKFLALTDIQHDCSIVQSLP
jgi:hypothetical protein